MNIFILSHNPVKAAQMQCDQHIVKMPLESAQILCTVFPQGKSPYRHTHYNHPCNKWARESRENFDWLLQHAYALCQEYTFRYGKIHAAEKVVDFCKENVDSIHFPRKSRTPFPIAMDDRYKRASALESYRNFYIRAKSGFARWNRNRSMPLWYRRGISESNTALTAKRSETK